MSLWSTKIHDLNKSCVEELSPKMTNMRSGVNEVMEVIVMQGFILYERALDWSQELLKHDQN